MSVYATLAPREIADSHPCFNEEAHRLVGRIHLPIAQRCNIHCNFCERRVCASVATQHPGWTAKVLSIREALELVDSSVNSREQNTFVVGVAGPGDPLANEETFVTLQLIHHRHPEIIKCISTNGLLLEDKLPQLLSSGVEAITVTVNAPNSSIGKYIYSWIHYQGIVYRNQEAAELLLVKQLRGIRDSLKAGLAVKVNTVLIPGVNDRSITELALSLKELGIQLMNIMPLIPSGKMRSNRAPTCPELDRIRRDCEVFVPQFYQCKQCRADAIYLP